MNCTQCGKETYLSQYQQNDGKYYCVECWTKGMTPPPEHEEEMARQQAMGETGEVSSEEMRAGKTAIWNEAKPIGDIGEEYWLKRIHRKYPKAYKVEGLDKEKDIVIPELGDLLIESKFDRMSKQTGRIAIEYAVNRQPSGIKVTKAKFWGIVYWSQRYGGYIGRMIKLDVLEFFFDHLAVGDTWGGAFKETQMRLVTTDSIDFFYDGLEEDWRKRTGRESKIPLTNEQNQVQ